MSIDAYKIAIQLSLVENVARGLASLAPHFNRANLSATELEARLTRISKLTLAGGAMASVGAFLVKGFIEPTLDAAKAVAKATASFESLNLSASDMALVKAKSLDMSHKVLGTTIAGNIELIQDLHTAFGSLEHALPVAESFAKYESSVAAQFGREKADGLVSATAKALEHRGAGVLNNPEEFQKELDLIAQVTSATRGMVDGKSFLAMSQTGKMAYMLMDKDALLQDAAIATTAGGASTVGTMHMTAYSSLVGGHMDNKGKDFFAGLGMYQEHVSKERMKAMKDAINSMSPEQKGEYMKHNGGENILNGGLTDKYAQMFATNPVKFMEEVDRLMIKRYGKGAETETQRVALITKNLNRNTSNYLGMIDEYHSKIAKDVAIFKKSMAVNSGYDHFLHSPDGAANALSSAFTNLKAVLGLQLLPSVISVTLKLAGFVDALAGFFERNPVIAKITMWFVTLAAGMLILGGAILLIKAAFVGLGLGAIGTVIAGIRSFFSIFPTILGAISPLGLVLLGIAALAFLAYNNWDEILKSFATMWALLKNGFTSLFHGDLIGVFDSFVGIFLTAFQMLLNTIIAGVNTVLPDSLQIPKMTYADGYNSRHNRDALPTSPNVRPGSNTQTIQPAPVILDGKQVASVVFKVASKEASRPSTSGGVFDSVMNFRPVGIN